jgi:hypothetical protein
MSKSDRYRERAAEHGRIAQECTTDTARLMHLRMRDSFLALAESEEWLNGVQPALRQGHGA